MKHTVRTLKAIGLMTLSLTPLMFGENSCNKIQEIDIIVPEKLIIEENKVQEIKCINIDRATRYNPTVAQCDNTPFHTADGSFIDTSKLRNKEIRWVALSWDLIKDTYRQNVRSEDWAWRGEFAFGDTIYVESKSKPMINGYWVVHDVMNGRYRKSMDFLYHEDNMNPRLGVCKDVKIEIN